MTTSKPMRAGDLTVEHLGSLVLLPPTSGGILPGLRRTIVLGGVRLWEYPAGTPRAGLLDTSDARGNIRGTEYSISGDAEVEVRDGGPRKPKRPRKGDYPEVAA